MIANGYFDADDSAEKLNAVRGHTERSGNSNDGWNANSVLPFMNFKFFEYAGELDHAVMIVHGEKAHSRCFEEDTF